MTVTALPGGQQEGFGRRLWGRAIAVVGVVAGTVGSIMRSQAKPTASHIKDHIYTWLGFGFVSAAAFNHSVFTGLLVTGIGWLIFEWKVSDEGDSHS